MRWIIALATIVALVTPAGAQGDGRPPASVRVAPVQERTIQERRRISGELRAVARARVATQEEGIVTELTVQEGQRVRSGDPLATLDRRRPVLELRRVEARVQVARALAAARAAEMDRARRDVESLASLEARGASNPKELADKRSALDVAVARRDEALQDVEAFTAEADLLRTRLEDMIIVAPFDGVVVTVGAERGEWVDKGDTIAEIVATGRYEAWLDVPQRHARWLLAADATIFVRVDGMDTTTPPRTPRVIRLVDPRARTFPVYVEVEDAEDRLAPGMSAVGWVPTGGLAPHITVPRDAIMRNQGGDFVYAVRAGRSGGEVAMPVPVTVLFETPDAVALRGSGLAAGDLVVVEGNERLFPMNPVAYPTPAAAAAEGG